MKGRKVEPLRDSVPRSKSKKKKRVRLPMLDVAHNCSLLAVDPATLSGCSLYLRGQLLEFGECDLFGDEPKAWIERLLAQPGPHAVIVERPFRVRWQSSTGLGVGDRIWRELVKRAGLGRRIVRVYPATWRSRTLGKGWASAEREDVKAEELKQAGALAVRHLGWASSRYTLGAESAPAILIGKWGCFAGETLAVLPKPRVKKARAA